MATYLHGSRTRPAVDQPFGQELRAVHVTQLECTGRQPDNGRSC